jgi:hypothetical protein
MLAFAGTAAAADAATVSVSLSPDKVSKNSAMMVSASGFPAASGLPTSAEFKVQKGFATSAKSVSVLCSASQAASSSCPAASKIGTGTASVTGTLGLVSVPDTVNFQLFLGAPKQAGDVASVDVTGSDTGGLATNITGSGRLFKAAGGGLDLLFDQFPTIALPPGTTVTLNSLSLSASATRTVTVKVGKRKHRHKKKVTYSLITNPSTCTGQWTGTATVTFASGPITQSLSTPCRK